MLRVIIADDERRVCNLILNIVPWTELGYQVIATVNNGLEAYDMICKHKPDVVITDARMPGYDGIELIKRTRESNLDPVFIIISGYKYFEYAYNALQYGVEHYLLKPINKTELYNALTKIKRSKMEENEKLHKESNILNQIAMTKDAMRRHFIKNFIFDGADFKTSVISSIDKINSEYQMNFKEGIYQALFVKIDKILKDPVKNEIVLDLVESEIESHFTGKCYEYVSAYAKSGILAVVNYPTSDKQNFNLDMNKLNDKLKTIIDKFNCFRLTIGIGISETGIENIPECIASAVEAVKYRITSTNKEIIDYKDYSKKRCNIQQIFTSERKQQLKNYIETDEKESYKKLINSCIREIHRENGYNPIIFYELFDAVGQTFLQCVNEIGIDTSSLEEIIKNFNEELDNAFEENVVIEILNNFIIAAASHICNEKEFKDSKPIRMAKQFIDEHFTEEISLDMVSKAIHLSSAYVSTIFRKETGLNFSDYLINCRIEEAKKLLKKTDNNMVEIAESIGYSDVKYFSKLFNKVVGLKPSEYRKLYS